MSARGPARNPIRAPAMPKQCDTENVATAWSDTVTAGISALVSSIASGPCVTSSIEQDPVALGEPRERDDLVGAGGGAVRVDRVDEADRARARRDRGRDPVGVEPMAGAGPSGTGTGRPPAAITADGRWK